MEVLNNIEPAVSPEKQAFRKILKAYEFAQPIFEEFTESNNLNMLTIASKVMPIINMVKKNPEPFKAVFNKEFIEDIKKFAK